VSFAITSLNYFLKNHLARSDKNFCKKEPGRRRSHFFNSFFVQTMFDEKNNDPKLRGGYNYKNLRHWPKNVPGKDIFDLSKIFIPIYLDNENWTLAVIFIEEKKIQYYDLLGEPCRKPPRYVPYKCTYELYNGTFGASDL
jgi:Ulp1 family protease